MSALKAISKLSCVLCVAVLAAAAQDSAPIQQGDIVIQASPTVPAAKKITLGELVDGAIRQEHLLIALVRNYRPILESYIQETQRDQVLGDQPVKDDYLLSRLKISGDELSTTGFLEQGSAKEEGKKEKREKKSRKDEPFTSDGFALALFPDLGHFNRENYNFKFVHWDDLGDLHCAMLDVRPKENTDNRGFVGQIWVEDQDYNIVRFTGAYTAKGFENRAYHFDSWRQNLISVLWLPSYVYTVETDPHDDTSNELWFKAQTRVWGYDMGQAGDHKEFDKRLTDSPVGVDPNRHEASQDLNPENTVGKTAYSTEDKIVERLQIAGLMAPDGGVDQILQTVVNNLIVTNNLDVEGVRCRVLLTTPLESFVMGRTIVVSRGLLDVLPDEASLAAVLAHELAHIVLGHSLGAGYLAGLSVPFSDREIFSKLDFHFDPALEQLADKKGMELLSNSPYKNQLATAALFLEELKARAPELPNLLQGKFSNDFDSSHLVAMSALATSPKKLQVDSVEQIAALPLGSRISLDPWSDKIEMIHTKPVRLENVTEKMPFEVSPFFPHMKRMESGAKADAAKQ